MSASEEKLDGLAPSQYAALSKSGAKTLAARGRADLRNKEEAEALLHKGLELYQDAFNDPGWRAICDPEWDSQRETHDQILRLREYFKRVLAGEDFDLMATELKITPEDREMARTVFFFLPSFVLSLVEASEKTMERYRTEVIKHEKTLEAAFCCFERGLALDPNNWDLIVNLAGCYIIGGGVEQDDMKAFYLVEKAAKMGDPRAQRAYGHYYSGAHDKKLAAYWFSKAAQQGDVGAIEALRQLDLG